VLPCVDVFVADEFCVWATILRTCLALRWGAQIADVPCVFVADVRWAAQLADVPCVADVPCLALRTCLVLRWGAQLADVPCVADVPCLALRTCLVLRWGAQLADVRTCLALRWGVQLADVPCVAFGRPSSGRALRCVGAPKLGEAVLKSLPPSQNLFLSILQLVF
jgi:hypothetical protein